MKLKMVMQVVNEIPFIPHYINSSVFPRCSFSDARFDLSVHVMDSAQVAFYTSALFKVEAKEEHKQALDFIYRSRTVLWDPPPKKSLEKTVTLKLCSQLLQYICKPNEVIIEYPGYEHIPIPGVQFGFIGLGSRKTWHGSPDVQVRGTANIVMQSMNEEKQEEEESGFDESDGMTTKIEVKRRVWVAHLPQAVATCITSSFTEHNLHPTMSPAVPTILIEGDTFRVILYDCIKDVLLISTPNKLHTDGRLSSTAVAFLWLVINHRQFLQPIPAECTKYPAKVKEVLQDSLEDFRALRSKNLNWHSESKPYFVEGSDLPISGNKRIKLSTNN